MEGVQLLFGIIPVVVILIYIFFCTRTSSLFIQSSTNHVGFCHYSVLS